MTIENPRLEAAAAPPWEAPQAATVTVLRVGATYPDMSALIHLREQGTQQEAPIHAVAIEAAGLRILVDTGLPDPEWVRESFGACTREPHERLEEALRALVGWELDDVQLVVNTHLHFDHAGGNHLFPRARIVVQRREWEYANAPEPGWAGIYPRFTFDTAAVDYFQWYFVDGDTELCPGVRLLLTPGHSAGHQSVAVKTADGVVVYAADAVSRMESLYERIPPGLYGRYEDAIASIDRIAAVADFVIPGHDGVVSSGQRTGFPAVRR